MANGLDDEHANHADLTVTHFSVYRKIALYPHKYALFLFI